MSSTPQWLFPLRKAAGEPTSRLLVFPYAAAGASSLRPLLTGLPGTVELLGVALPGRERRFAEPPLTDSAEFLTAVAGELSDRPALPTALLGHSMGASLALSLALAAPDSCHGVVISGREPSGVALATMLDLSDDEITGFFGTVGHTAPQLLADAYWRERLIALFRSDIHLDLRTSAEIETRTLDQQLLVLGGAEDPYVAADDLIGWSARTTGRCDISVHPGDHFFILSPGNRDAVLAALTGFLGRLRRRQPVHP
ncbi:thioesterase II family protein [Streptomyces sp. NPDC004561]